MRLPKDQMDREHLEMALLELVDSEGFRVLKEYLQGQLEVSQRSLEESESLRKLRQAQGEVRAYRKVLKGPQELLNRLRKPTGE